MLAGEWTLSYTLGRSGRFEGSVLTQSGKIESTGNGRVRFQGMLHVPSDSAVPNEESVLLDLRYDGSAKRYLVDFQVGESRRIENLPLAFDPAKGFTGAGQMRIGDRNLPAEVGILASTDESTWDVKVNMHDPRECESYRIDFSKAKAADGTTAAKNP